NNDKYKKGLKEIFNEDQIKALLTKKRRTRNWLNETIKRALRLRFTCGNNGYEELLQQKMPLPSLRTLQRRLEDLKFKSGISKEMFDFLQFKVSSFQNDTDRECGIVIDEISITPKRVYDSSTKTLLGNITFPNKEGIATHALTLMLTGTANRWKHIVGYFYTGDSFDGTVLKDIILQIIDKAELIGLRVNYITSDMSPGNSKL
ncbi:uncharacterized protein, partial [Mycetomoellerius zeteki]|uniref:uncharacterized protein n=1 Tax=Mycetomoellerius zeteki TaxID=64791 RepID=UPI00084EA79B